VGFDDFLGGKDFFELAVVGCLAHPLRLGMWLSRPPVPPSLPRNLKARREARSWAGILVGRRTKARVLDAAVSDYPHSLSLIEHPASPCVVSTAAIGPRAKAEPNCVQAGRAGYGGRLSR
jgi:hypothetical protein